MTAVALALANRGRNDQLLRHKLLCNDNGLAGFRRGSVAVAAAELMCRMEDLPMNSVDARSETLLTTHETMLRAYLLKQDHTTEVALHDADVSIAQYLKEVDAEKSAQFLREYASRASTVYEGVRVQKGLLAKAGLGE
jgi:hypothetical protein